MSSVGDMLRLARQRMGFTQQIAAGRLGVVQPVLSRFEHGVSEPDTTFLAKAARVYNVPKDFFDIRDPVYGPPVSVHPREFRASGLMKREFLSMTSHLYGVGRRPIIGGGAEGRPKGWSPERRARQAVLIRGWQPWQRSTGPKTEAGKARCSMNALKHGCRGRAYLQTASRVR